MIIYRILRWLGVISLLLVNAPISRSLNAINTAVTAKIGYTSDLPFLSDISKVKATDIPAIEPSPETSHLKDPIPRTDAPATSTVQVLQIYPDGHSTTVVAQAIYNWSTMFHIDVLPVTTFNTCTSVTCTETVTDPMTGTTTSRSIDSYDILFFGAADGYGGYDLSPDSANVVREFAQLGRGIVFTHDTVAKGVTGYPEMLHPNFASLIDVHGIDLIDDCPLLTYNKVDLISGNTSDPVLNSPNPLPASFNTLDTHYGCQKVVNGTTWYDGSDASQTTDYHVYIQTYFNPDYGSYSSFYSYGHTEDVPLEWEAKAMINSMYFAYHGGGFYVDSTVPSDGATEVPITTTAITASFSKAVSVDSLNQMTILLSDGVSNITGSIDYDAATKTLTFDPAYLAEGTTYTMTLTSGIVAADNPNTHLSQYQWRFTTVGSKRDKLITALRDLKNTINGKILYDADTVGFNFGLARQLHKLKNWIDFLSLPSDVVLMWTGNDAPKLYGDLDTFKDIVGKVGLAMKIDGVIDDTPGMEGRFDTMVQTADEAYGGNPLVGIEFDLPGYQQDVKYAVMDSNSPVNSIPLMNGQLGTNPSIVQRSDALDVRSDISQKFDSLINGLPDPLPSTIDVDQLVAELNGLTHEIQLSKWREQNVTYSAYFPTCGGLCQQTFSLGVVAQDGTMSNALIHSAADDVDEQATMAAMKTSVGGVKLMLLVASASASAVAETIYLPVDLALLPKDVADVSDQLMGIDTQSMLDEHAYRTVLHYGQETSTVWRIANDVVSTMNYRLAHPSRIAKTNASSSVDGISVTGLQMPDVILNTTSAIGSQTGSLTLTNPGGSTLRVTLNGQIVGPADSSGELPILGVFGMPCYVDIAGGATVPLSFTYSALRSSTIEPSGYEGQVFLNVLDMSTLALASYGPWRTHFFAGTPDQLAVYGQQTITLPISGTIATGQVQEQLFTLLPTTHRVRFVLSQGQSSDLDLHVYDTAGHHVGMNYTTMSTETQIAGSTYSGNQAQTEWVEIEPVIGAQQFRVQVVGMDAGDATHYEVALVQTPALPAVMDAFPQHIRMQTSNLTTSVSFKAQEVAGQTGITNIQLTSTDLNDGQGHIIPAGNIMFTMPVISIEAGAELPITATINMQESPTEGTYLGSFLLTGQDAGSGDSVTATIEFELTYTYLHIYLTALIR